MVRTVITLLAALLVAAPVVRAGAPCPTTPLVSGLKGPSKIVLSTKGNLLVAEAGDAVNAGRVSIVDPDTGARRTLLDGLPAGVEAAEGNISGPSGLAVRGRTLYITIGAGDGVVPGPAPGSELANPSPSSPIVSSVLEVKFSSAVEKNTAGFTLTLEDHEDLAAGRTVKLKNRGKDKISVRLVADFENFTPNPRPDVPDNVRASNPFAVEIVAGALYVADASQNKVERVTIASGDRTTVATFEPLVNTLPFGPPMVDAVPDNVHFVDGGLLVPQLSGFPFGPGASRVSRVDLTSGAVTPLVTGLTMAIDVLDADDGLFVLEFSSNFLGDPPGPGRLLRFDDPAGEPVVVADCLVSPTSMARDRSGAFYVSQIFTGQIVVVEAS
jgi:hypothetical protein